MIALLLVPLPFPALAAATNTYIVAAYNVENWTRTDRDGTPDQPKPLAEREAVVNILASVRPDVLGVQEIGTTNDLAELADRLAQRGLVYPYREWIEGSDYERHVALLSRFPIGERFSRTDYHYTEGTNQFRMSRGVLDVSVRISDRCALRAVVAHLKSRRVSDRADQAEMRAAEARLLRAHVDAALRENPAAELLVMGDLNDTPGTLAIRTVVGTGPFRLFDLRPLDSHGGSGTQYWRFRQQFSRIDYLLATPALARKLVPGSARIADATGWLAASDHRALYATFATDPSAAVAATRNPHTNDGSQRYLGFGLGLLLVAVAAVLRIIRRRR